jgi:CheY-like chemotaxis protein/RNase P subunit RPR2
MSPDRSLERLEQSPATGGAPERPRVLLVDPDENVRALYRNALRAEGWSVVEAADGRDALTMALVWPPALVITEIRLPIVSGPALCEILRRDCITSTVPIIVVTAAARDAALDRPDLIGADRILAKPATPDRLLDEVRRLIAVGRTLSHRDAGAIDPAPAPPVSSRTKRIALTKLHQRFATTEPPASPPSLFCPSCDRPLVYEHSDIGGVSSKNGEQWDTFTCASCGRFEYRHRTRKLRQVP